MAIKKSKSGVKLTAPDLLGDPNMALALAFASVGALRKQRTEVADLNAQVELLLKKAESLQGDVTGAAATLDEKEAARKQLFAEARSKKKDAAQATARFDAAKRRFILLCAAAEIDPMPKKRVVKKKKAAKPGKFAAAIGPMPADVAPKKLTTSRRPTKKVDEFEALLAEVERLAKKQAKLAPVVAVATVLPENVALFGKDVTLADLEKHVEALLQARAAEVQSAVDAQLTVHKDAEAELRKLLAQANAQVTAKNTDLTTLKAQIATATAEHNTLQQQLATAEGLRTSYAGALGEVILYVDKRFNPDVERIRTKYHLK